MRILAAFALLLGALLGSCGYHTGLIAPEGAKTIGVEFFGNDGPLRDVELELYQALSRSIERMVPGRLVAPAEADLVVRGRVVNYSLRDGIRSPEDKLLETGVRITVEASLVDLERRLGPEGEVLPPRVLRKTRTVSERGYRIEETNGQQDARARAMRNLADRLTLDLFGPVVYEPDEAGTQTQELGSY